MSVLAYILATLLALVYATLAWKLYPHFISIKDQVVRSGAQLLWGRFAASWLLFVIVVVGIPLNWNQFDEGVRSFLGSDKHANIEPGPKPVEDVSANSVTVSRSVERTAAAPAPQPLERSSTAETSQTSTSQAAPSEEFSQQPDERPAMPPAQGMTTPGSSATFAPSFDCAKASTGPERLICSNQQLASLDVQLMQVYRRAMSVAPSKNSLKAAQVEWIKYQRNACSTAECMISAYETRIQSLETITAH